MNYMLDSHTHTLASGHAYSTVHEMAGEASRKGLKLLGITEHSMSMPGTCPEFYFVNFKVLPRILYGVEMVYGVELNILDFDGNVDMDERILRRMDVAIASLHTPCIRSGSREENTRAYLKVMENPYVNIIGHPDDSRYPVDYDALVRKAVSRGVLLELNNTSLAPYATRKGAWENDLTLLAACKKYRAPIILSSDAHTQEDVGNFTYLEEILAKAEFPEELIVNRSVQEYKKYINQFRKNGPEK